MSYKYKIIGIYGIFYNNECVYVGKTTHFKRRISQHKSDAKLRANILKIDKFINENDINKFEFKMLETCTIEMLSFMEEKWIMLYNPKYNFSKNDKDMSFANRKEYARKKKLTSSKNASKGIIICKEILDIKFDNIFEWVEYFNNKGININNHNISNALHGKTKNGYAKGYHFYLT